VLVVADEETVRVRRKSSLAGAREPEEERDIVALDSDIGGGVQ
jgi:hypothetical protein